MWNHDTIRRTLAYIHPIPSPSCPEATMHTKSVLPPGRLSRRKERLSLDLSSVQDDALPLHTPKPHVKLFHGP